MKIVFVTSHLTVYLGYGKFLMDYANLFYKKGHNITIIALKVDKKNYSFNEEIKIIEIGSYLPSNPLFWLNFNIIKKKYIKILNKLDCELIISLNFPSNYFCANVNKRNSSKHVYYCLEPYRFFHDKKFYSSAPLHLKIISWILRILFKKYDIIGTLAADEILSISNFTKNRIKEWYNRDSFVHYIGVEIDDSFEVFDLKRKLMLKKNTPIIFSLGFSHHLKGARELILIFNKILEICPETILLIGGFLTKSSKKIMERLLKNLKIPQENIIFYGFIEKQLLNYFYKNSTITFYTAIDESYGLIPLESMKNGTPVIAFEGGPSETILNGETGFLIKNHNLEEFAQKAIKIIKYRNLNDTFSKKSIEHVKKNFSLEKSTLDLLSILQKYISKG